MRPTLLSHASSGNTQRDLHRFQQRMLWKIVRARVGEKEKQLALHYLVDIPTVPDFLRSRQFSDSLKYHTKLLYLFTTVLTRAVAENKLKQTKLRCNKPTSLSSTFFNFLYFAIFAFHCSSYKLTPFNGIPDPEAR